MIVPTIIDDISGSHALGIGQWRIPVLIGVFGLPGTGKTETTAWLATRYPLVVLSTDALRLRHHLPSGPATIDVMYEVAARLLPQRVAIVFDGIHMRRSDRVRLRQFAEEHRADWAFIHTIAEPAVIERRLEARRRDADHTRAEGKFVITPDHFTRIASWLEVPVGEERVWQIDTSADRSEVQPNTLAQWLSDRLQGY